MKTPASLAALRAVLAGDNFALEAVPDDDAATLARIMLADGNRLEAARLELGAATVDAAMADDSSDEGPAPGRLEAALIAMAGACDGGRTVDGAGFSKADAGWLAPHVQWAREGRRLADELRAPVLRRIMKYGKQLQKAGVNLNAIAQEERRARRAAARQAAGEKAPPPADQIVALARAAGDVLFTDERGDPYVRVSSEHGTRILRVDSMDYRRRCRARFFASTGRGASGETVATATGTLAALAAHEGDVYPLHNRFAHVDGAIWLDLADEEGRAVRVTADGWELVDEPPILFRRHAHQLPLPAPERGATMADVARLLPCKREGDRLLLLAWLPAAMVADVPRPIVNLHGSQGSGKTTCARMLRGLLDPSRVATLRLPAKIDELAQQADHHAVPSWDNLGLLRREHSDLLCVVVTGGGIAKRQLYTDADDIFLSFLRAVILTGVTLAGDAPDLLERCLLLELEPIAPADRREEADMWSCFEADRGLLLGAILDTLAGAMRLYPTIRPRLLPRMADWARWGAAAAEAMGYGAAAFLEAYRANAARQHEEVIEAHPIAQAVRALALDPQQRNRHRIEARDDEHAPHCVWHGEAADLLKLLESRRTDEPHRGDGWPRAANALSRRLKILRSTLRAVGVTIDTLPQMQKRRILSIGAVPSGADDDTCDDDDDTVSNIVVGKPASRLHSDDTDDDDDIFPLLDKKRNNKRVEDYL